MPTSMKTSCGATPSASAPSAFAPAQPVMTLSTTYMTRIEARDTAMGAASASVRRRCQGSLWTALSAGRAGWAAVMDDRERRPRRTDVDGPAAEAERPR
jgi:hypothetical protein